MSAKPIREFDGKELLSYFLSTKTHQASVQFDLSHLQEPGSPQILAETSASFTAHTEQVLDATLAAHPWLSNTRLVCKPDQLIKRRGKAGLLGINLDWEGVRGWIKERAGKSVVVEKTSGVLDTFIVEPFIAHPADSEYYVCIVSGRAGDEVLFTHQGGVEVGDVDAKAKRMLVGVGESFPGSETVVEKLLSGICIIKLEIPQAKHAVLVDFLTRLYAVYSDLHFTYLEINPLVVLGEQVYYLDLAAKLDQTAEFECGKKWATARMVAYGKMGQTSQFGPAMYFPAPFGRSLTREEAYISDLDSKTGASLKLTILNPNGLVFLNKGRIWTMVAGGGASVVYTDAIAAHGYASEIANYGEYSGAPSESQTYEYAKTILDLMTRGQRNPDGIFYFKKGKILFIGGGIANFTNVAATFKGIIRALKDFQRLLKAHKVKIYVRRAGPNYQEGLRLIREVSDALELGIKVFGPEMFVTGIVPLALLGDTKGISGPSAEKGLLDMNGDSRPSGTACVATPTTTGFTPETRAFIYGMQPRAVQGMLDFDYMCKRSRPSVAAMIYPFGGVCFTLTQHHVQKFYWGTKETLLPVYPSVKEAAEKFPDVSVVCNFASFRSVYESTLEILQFPQISTIAIIAEGVPEKRARELLHLAKRKGVLIIGPATVGLFLLTKGGIKPGCFKIGNTGGMMDNIVSSKLYRPGSVAYVSKSGGMSNVCFVFIQELNNIISRATDGVYEGIAIGGDRYPGSTFIDHMLRFQADPAAKIMVLLGEVGGVEEYEIVQALKTKRITKPVVAWCIGTCSTLFTTDVQFGHAGSFANSTLETADAKNSALRAAGALVPQTFEDLPELLSTLYSQLVAQETIRVAPEPEQPKIPIDYAWAQEPASFISTICDDRGQELSYAGMAISEVFKEDIGVGGVLSLLWFKRRLPAYASKFIEMVLQLTADHGPAVSGAHNTIVTGLFFLNTARAGKDLISSLVAGLLTIGERFGGALDGAAQMFSAAYDAGQSPQEFVDAMRKSHTLILGIGHKIKSRTNPDLRVEIIKQFAMTYFPSTEILQYALAVEQITTAKKDNLILNVDGVIGCVFVDMVRNCSAFSRQEAEEYIKIGTLNGLFVLGRSIGFIGHYLDQKRLKQGLYRHPWDDISYMIPESQDGVKRTFVEPGKVVEKGTENAF